MMLNFMCPSNLITFYGWNTTLAFEYWLNSVWRKRSSIEIGLNEYFVFIQLGSENSSCPIIDAIIQFKYYSLSNANYVKLFVI